MRSEKKQIQIIDTGVFTYTETTQNVIKFIESHLYNFKVNFDDIDKKDTDLESSYNNQLSKYFNACLTNEAFQFQHEDKKKNKRRPDIGISIKAEVLKGNYKSFFDIECKRLNTKMRHVYQYVSGKTGGIERFKRNLHGTNLPESAMIAYIENETYDYWFDKINYWLKNQNKKDSNFWTNSEQLSKTNEVYYKSSHKRIDSNKKEIKNINLFHFFTIVTNKKK